MNLYRNELIQDYKEAGRYDKTLDWWLDHLEKGNLCDADVMRLVAEIDRLKVREKRDCAAIIKLREKLKEANDRTNELYCSLEAARDTVDPRDAEIENLRERIAELEAQREWHDASEPPDDGQWVLVEMKDGDEKFIMPCWYDGYPDKYWHVEHFRMGDVLRWRELPGGKEKSE